MKTKVTKLFKSAVTNPFQLKSSHQKKHKYKTKFNNIHSIIVFKIIDISLQLIFKILKIKIFSFSVNQNNTSNCIIIKIPQMQRRPKKFFIAY